MTRIRQLTLMPVAVGEVSDAGIPNPTLNRLSGALNQARIRPTSFNIILRTIVNREGLEGVQSLTGFVHRKNKQGLVRSEVTVAVRDYLNTHYNVAWDFLERTRPTALSDRFIPQSVRARIKKQRIQEQQARGLSDSPEWNESSSSSYLKSMMIPGRDGHLP